MAELLLARTSGIQSFERHVVIKRIRPELASDIRFVQMFLDEARLAASLHHQHIVQVYDVGEQDGAYFFAMEYVHGEDVRSLIDCVRERGELVPLEVAAHIVIAAASGLHHAHEQLGPDRTPLGIVHRDVSPANILIGFDGSVKLVDFGLAKAMRSVQTRTGSLKGKAGYMSPEQCHGRPLDRRSDVFALGIVLYEIATARRLFQAGNDFLTMAAIVGGEVPPPSTFRDDLPRELDAIVLRALAKPREARFQSADELRAALERFMLSAGLRTSTKALSDYMRRTFGDRAEPWLDDQTERAAGRPGTLDGSAGIVEPPPTSDDLVADVPRSSSPIALAHALADGSSVGPNPDDDGVTVASAPLAGGYGEDAPTVISDAPPMLGDETTTTAVDHPPESDELPTVAGAHVAMPTDDVPTVAHGRSNPETEDVPTVAHQSYGDDLPTTAATRDPIYVGPPARPRWRAAVQEHRALAVALAMAALLVIVLAIALIARGSGPAPAPAGGAAGGPPVDAPAAAKPHHRKR